MNFKKIFRLAPVMVVSVALTTMACWKKDEQPKTDETQMAPSSTGTMEEAGVPPVAAPAPAEGEAGAPPAAPAPETK